MAGGGKSGAKEVLGAAKTDGRALRAAKNHEAIVRAVYEFVRATHRPPAVEEVAERAGVGTRTVFRQFEDLDTLYRSMGERVQREILALISIAPPSGKLDEDLSALIARRARIFEHITPFRRVARLVRHKSPFLQEQEALTARMFRAALEAVVRPHLGDGAENIVEALDALLSFDVWDRLRDPQRLGVKRAEQVLVEAATVLVHARGERSRP